MFDSEREREAIYRTALKQLLREQLTHEQQQIRAEQERLHSTVDRPLVKPPIKTAAVAWAA